MRILAAFSILVLSCSAIAAEPQAMFRGDAHHSGVTSAKGLPALHGVKWKFHCSGSVSSPALSAGTLYLGCDDARLYALEAATGAKKWEFKTGGRVASSPAVANGLVYVLSYDGKFYAIDAKSGEARWSFSTEGERRFAAPHLHGGSPETEVVPDPFDFYLSSPVLAQGMVYFGSGDRHIYALDAKSGTLKWKFAAGNVVHGTPAVADGTLYIGGFDSRLYALDAATGAEKWRFQAGLDDKIHNQEGFQSSPAVANGLVYVGCRDSKFYALDTASGKVAWSYDNKGSWVIGSPAVTKDAVYFATSDTGLFHAVDARTGAERFQIGTNHWPMFSSPVVAGGTVYIGSHHGQMMAIDIAAQKTAWSFDVEAAPKTKDFTDAEGKPDYSKMFASPFYDDVVEGVIRTRASGAVLSTPLVADGAVYFASADGEVYALD
jgi:outer membrane protein assembly factor BamB